MKKIIIALIALVFSLSGYAQFMVDNSANIICLSGSAGIGVTNTSINLTSLDVKKVEFSYCFNLAYQHIGRKGWGFGINAARFTQSKDKADENIEFFYVGPSLVGSTLLNKWRIYGSAGLGYAKQNDLLFNRGGFGIYLGTGFEYKLTKHFAIGVVMNDYITMFNIKNNNGHVSFDNLHVGLSLSYFF